jgi:hypothetical protein
VFESLRLAVRFGGCPSSSLRCLSSSTEGSENDPFEGLGIAIYLGKLKFGLLRAYEC